MLERLKRTEMGVALYRFSRREIAGWPVRKLAEFAQFCGMQLARFKPANRRHNARARAALARFEAGLK